MHGVMHSGSCNSWTYRVVKNNKYGIVNVQQIMYKHHISLCLEGNAASIAIQGNSACISQEKVLNKTVSKPSAFASWLCPKRAYSPSTGGFLIDSLQPTKLLPFSRVNSRTAWAHDGGFSSTWWSYLKRPRGRGRVSRVCFLESRLDSLGVSKNSGTPKSSILIGFSIIKHPFWGTTIFGNTHIVKLLVVGFWQVMVGRNKSLKFGGWWVFCFVRSLLEISEHAKASQ